MRWYMSAWRVVSRLSYLSDWLSVMWATNPYVSFRVNWARTSAWRTWGRRCTGRAARLRRHRGQKTKQNHDGQIILASSLHRLYPPHPPSPTMRGLRTYLSIGHSHAYITYTCFTVTCLWIVFERVQPILMSRFFYLDCKFIKLIKYKTW